MKKNTRLGIGIAALTAGILTSQAVLYFTEKNLITHDMITEELELHRILNSPKDQEMACQIYQRSLKELDKRETVKDFITGEYGVREAFRDYVKKHCKK